MSAPTWSPCTATPTTANEAWPGRTARAVAQGLLAWVARHAQRRQYRARRQRVLSARHARLQQRRQAHLLERELARQLSRRLGRDIGLR